MRPCQCPYVCRMEGCESVRFYRRGSIGNSLELVHRDPFEHSAMARSTLSTWGTADLQDGGL